MNPVSEQYNDQIFITVSPYRSPRVTSMTKGVGRKVLSAWRVILDGYCIPPQSSTILVGKPVFSLVEPLYCTFFKYPLSFCSDPLVQMYLHIFFHVFNNGEESSVTSYPSKQVGSRVMNLPSDELLPKHQIKQPIPLNSVGAIRQSYDYKFGKNVVLGIPISIIICFAYTSKALPVTRSTISPRRMKLRSLQTNLVAMGQSRVQLYVQSMTCFLVEGRVPGQSGRRPAL